MLLLVFVCMYGLFVCVRVSAACADLHGDRALCIRRTRTDADGRGHFIFIKKKKKKKIGIYLRAQLERDPESDRLGHPPPPN